MKTVTCAHEHAEAIRTILNEAILKTTAIYDYQPRTKAMMESWFAAKEQGGYPVIGVENEAGELMGFGSYGPFRAWPAYKYTVEHSVYVDERFRRRGIGRQILLNLIEAAKLQNYHTLVGGIDAENAASIALHQKLGFTPCGRIRHAGFKFGRWLDLEFHQLLLPTPLEPKDG